MNQPAKSIPPSRSQHSQNNHNNVDENLTNNSSILHINGTRYDLTDHTPMMVQYLTMKAKYPNALLLYRMGDFYELFFDDAYRAAEILDITLTRRGNDKAGNNIAMAGVPFHAADSYMARLIAAGQTVVICEQVEDAPNSKNNKKSGVAKAASKGIMRREVVKTLTAGTLTDDVLIAPNQTPSVVAIDLQFIQKSTKPNHWATSISQLDLNAGTLRTQTITLSEINKSSPLDKHVTPSEVENILKQRLLTVLTRFAPSEVILPETTHDDWRHWLQNTLDCPVISVAASDFNPKHASQTLCRQFNVQTLEGLGIANHTPAQTSCAALIHYAQQTQQRHTPQVAELIVERDDDYLIIDDISSRNLELFTPVSPTGTSLLSVVNHCQTPMGKRLLVTQLKRPLRIATAYDTLNLRLDAVEWLTQLSNSSQITLQEILKNIADIERISSRIGLHSAKPRDLKRLADSIHASKQLAFTLNNLGLITGQQGLLPMLALQLPEQHVELLDIASLLERSIVDEPPAHIRDGGMLATGYDDEFDRLVNLHDNIQDTLDSMAEAARQDYHLPSLKVGFNKVSGFYFELPKGQASQAPEQFIRRQTLKNSERFITDELKTLEIEYLDAQTNALAREKALYHALLVQLSEKLNHLQRLSSAVAQIDVLLNWATLAKECHWVRPSLNKNTATDTKNNHINIVEGRHLVVEAMSQAQTTVMSNEHFVANDCTLGTANHPERMLLITGPNMGGKSTYMRQTALIVLLACCGSFVPAKSASVGDIDRIFTRIGSADDLAGGKSTFMVEMIETAQILNLATNRSLVLMDEVGRGTSTTDGLAIAYACALKLCEIQSLTLFATHYFELTQLADTYNTESTLSLSSVAGALRNVHVAASHVDGQLLLLHKIQNGAASSSFGLHVAKMAGVPDTVLTAAQDYLSKNTASVTVEAIDTVETIDNKEISHPNHPNKADSEKERPVNATLELPKPSRQIELNVNETATNYQVSKSDSANKITQMTARVEHQKAESILCQLNNINPDELTPRQALDLLYALKQNT